VSLKVREMTRVESWLREWRDEVRRVRCCWVWKWECDSATL
jgi:hypothetical protein